MKRAAPRKSLVTTRRKLLTLMGFGSLCCGRLDPIRMITRSLVDGLIAEAEAEGTAPVKNFISILNPGAITPWIWSGFLNLNNESIVSNASVNNWLAGNSYAPAPIAGGYRSEAVTLSDGRTVYLPPLWNRSIPKSAAAGGGTVPMKSLLDNTLIMRGVDMQADLGHVVGPAKALFPIAAEASLTGLVGDASSTPLPVVGTSGPFSMNYADPILQGYKSLKGTSPTLIRSSTDALTEALSPFINSDSAVIANGPILNSAPVRAAIANALTELGNYTRASMPGSNALYNNAGKATQLFQTAFGDLHTQFTTLASKYAGLATACAHTAIPNILPSSGSAGYNFAASATDAFSYQFAVAEYMIVNGYSSTVCMSNAVATSVANLLVYADEHTEADRPKSVICNSYLFLVISAMVYELRRVLVAHNLWNNTLVHITSEFGRCPRADGSGSDHSPASNVITMMSGAIPAATFIGNILATSDPQEDTYTGTYGVAAPVLTNSGSTLVTNNIAAATAAAILGVQNPLSQSSSIISVNSEGQAVTSLAEAPRNV